jgi:4-hydroxythreonine-4-phosphate dehydrogenase
MVKNYQAIKDLIIDCGAPVRFRYGAPDRNTGRAALTALESALESRPDFILTAPIVKEAVRYSRPGFSGHTEFLAQYYGVREFGMLGINRAKRILLLTTHLPLRDIFRFITPQRVLRKLVLLDWGLRNYFAVRRPTVAVGALNPHAFEFSRGEDERILQGVLGARHRGLKACGPFPSDSLFNRDFDGFLAIFHDQGMTYLKARPGGLNFTLGLPVIRLSPLHGAALDIAGQNRADGSGMITALRAGFVFFRNYRQSQTGHPNHTRRKVGIKTGKAR